MLTHKKLVAPLWSDTDGAPPQEEWSYASVILMLLYLAFKSRF